jgi:hypothetical protein
MLASKWPNIRPLAALAVLSCVRVKDIDTAEDWRQDKHGALWA